MNGAAAGNYDTIVILGANLKYNAPAELDIESILGNIETKIHLGSYYDETARLCNWHANEAQFLEAWGDGMAYTGEQSIIQLQILHLHEYTSTIEDLSSINDG